MPSPESIEFNEIKDKLGLNAAEFARKLKVDPRTVRNALSDRFTINPAMLQRARKLVARMKKEAIAELTADDSQTELPLEAEPAPKPKSRANQGAEQIMENGLPAYAAPENLKRLREALNYSQRQMAEYFGIHTSYYHTFEKGLNKTSRRILPAVKNLHDYVARGDFNAPLPPVVLEDATSGRKATRVRGVESLLAATTEFQERFRLERNQRLVEAATDFVHEKTGIERRLLLRALMLYSAMLKDNMTFEELTNILIEL